MINTHSSTRPTLIDDGLNFSRYGYFTRPLPRDGSRVLAVPEVDLWFELEDLIMRPTRGDFSAVPTVLECCRKTHDWRLKKVATQVLGHVGTLDCFRDMRTEIEQHPARRHDVIDVPTRELILLYCHAFASWGRLDVVPVLMDQYLTLRLKHTPEIALLPLLMADLLIDDENTMIAHEPPEEHLEDYLNLVMEQYESLSHTFGSDKVLVFRGALQSVRGLAERMRHFTTTYIYGELLTLRERFEPATGIDCSAIFEGPSVRPLTAAALAEQFLDSSEAVRFEDGTRYFFGHVVPA